MYSSSYSRCYSVTKLYLTLWLRGLQHARLLSPPLSEFAQIHVHRISDALILCCPPFPFAFNLSEHQDHFQRVGSYIRWWKYSSFSFSISPSNEYSALISFRIDWFDILTVQGILKSLLQLHNLKASILWHSAFFMVQLSHSYMTTGKTIALTRWTFFSKVMSPEEFID